MMDRLLRCLGRHNRNLPNALTAPDYNFGRCFFLLWFAFSEIGKRYRVNSHLPRMSTKESPAGAGRLQGQDSLVERHLPPFFGFHSRANRCASAICAGVINAAALSRFLTAPSRTLPGGKREMARLNHMWAWT